MTLTLRPHDWKRTKNGRAVLVRNTPYIRLHTAGEVPIYVQRGLFYTEDGKEIEKVPQWAQDQVKLLTPEAKKEVGLVRSGKDDVS